MSQSPPRTPRAYQLAPATPDTHTPPSIDQPGSESDYRTRFHRSVNGPTPFNRPALSAESLPGAPSSSRLEPLPSTSSAHNGGDEDGRRGHDNSSVDGDDEVHDDGHGRLSHLRVVTASDASEEEKPKITNGKSGGPSSGSGEAMAIDPNLHLSGEGEGEGEAEEDELEGENEPLSAEQERAKAAAEYFKNWQALSAARLDAERRIRHIQLQTQVHGQTLHSGAEGDT